MIPRLANKIVLLGLDGATWRKLDEYVEKGLMPVSKYLGWRPYFPFSEFNAYAKLNVKSISKVNLFDYWGIIHAINSPAV